MKVDYQRTARQLAAISRVTFHELIRERILWSALLFALLAVGLALAASQLSYTDNARIALTFGLTSISIIGGLLAVVMGSTLIAKEVQNRTAYLILTKAVWRWQLIVGRFVGLMGVLALNTVIMSVVLLVLFLLLRGTLDASFAKSVILQLTEFSVLSAVALIFSAFSTITLAAIITSGVWVIGHAMGDLKLLVDKIEPEVLRPVLKTATIILPDLSRFDIKAQVAHQLPVSWSYVSLGFAYGLAYVIFALLVACLVFTKRDL